MIYFLIFLNLLLSQQDDVLLKQEHQSFCIDHLGSIYLLNRTEVTKCDIAGDNLPYSNSFWGNITSIDISDPLRVILFYKDFNKVDLLDRNFAKIGSSIDLYDFSENDTDLICSSQKGGFWTYNMIDNQAIHYRSNGEISTESILLTGFFENESPDWMIESESRIFLLYENNGLLVLDENGQLTQKHQIDNIQHIQIKSCYIYYSTPTGLYRYDLKEREPKLVYKLSSNSYWSIHNGILYLSNGKSISIKKLNS